MLCCLAFLSKHLMDDEVMYTLYINMITLEYDNTCTRMCTYKLSLTLQVPNVCIYIIVHVKSGM